MDSDKGGTFLTVAAKKAAKEKAKKEEAHKKEEADAKKLAAALLNFDKNRLAASRDFSGKGDTKGKESVAQVLFRGKVRKL